MSSPFPTPHPVGGNAHGPSFAAVCGAGLLALAVAMGIGRFAFTPMLPLMIRAGTADVSIGGWLAAANYAGYLLGALSLARVPLSPQRTGLWSLTAIALSTLAMGLTASVPLWLLLRFVAGLASAWVLVSTSVWCLAWLARFGRPAGAGLLYAGVGVGIALAGLYCWQAGAQGLAPARLWQHLGGWALLGLLLVALLMPRGAAPAPGAAQRSMLASVPSPARVPWGLVICYGLFGFGYILPATFVPVLARAVVDDPALFGAAWPVFGTAAALSTLLASLALARVPRRHVLAGSYVLMALGCVLPVWHLTVWTVLLSALLVGGSFMVATMAGMQAVRERTSGDPTRALGLMTASFALGQMVGPLLSSWLSHGAQGVAGLSTALMAGALALAGGAAWLALGRAA